MKNNYNFDVVKLHLKFNQRTKSTPHKFKICFPSQNLILFQPDLCQKGMRIIMKNLFIEYPKCSTCKKAKKWLEDNKIEFEDRHIIENNPTEDELKDWIRKSEKEIKKWFNTSGLKYKELNLKDKLSNMTDEEKIKTLASDGILVKRPIFISQKGILIGFKEEEWKRVLKG